MLHCFLRAELCSIVGLDHIFFVHLSVGGHSECFQPFFSPSFFLLFGYTVWHAGPQFSNQGSDPHTLQWKPGFLTSGLPGTSLPGLLFKNSVYDFNGQFVWESLEWPLTPALEGCGGRPAWGWGARIASLPKDAFIVRQMASQWSLCGFLSSGAFSSPGCLL